MPILHKGKAKKKKDDLTPKPIKDIKVPERLTKPATVRSMSRGVLQKKIHAFFGPNAMIDAYQGCIRAAREGNVPAITNIFKLYGLLPSDKGGGITIFNSPNFQQNNANEAIAAAASKSKGPSDFEDIVRVLEEERKVIDVRSREVMPTPEGAAE